MNQGGPTFLALGDSYTIGEAVGTKERWPEQLVEELRSKGIAVNDPEIIAKTGWTTDELNAAIDEQRPAGPYDLVTLLIGVNNQYRGRPLANYETEFSALLQRAITFAGNDASHVIVVSIPDWGVTPFAASRDSKKIATEINTYNASNRRLALAAGARYVDITPGSRRADPTLIAPDGLHPSAQMYAEWTQQILPEAEVILRSAKPAP